MTSIEQDLQKYNWTPLHTRILSHRIGDGTCNTYGRYVWVNKYPQRFIELSTKLKIKFWGPYKSDRWGTSQVVMHWNLQRKLGKVVDTDPQLLVKDCVQLVKAIKKLPKEHKVQALLAIIVDDGSCKNWRLNVMSDMDHQVSLEVLNLWNSLYPDTAKIAVYTTKHGTPVYRIWANREGIIQLKNDIDIAVDKYGEIANLWWKQEAFDERWAKATSKRALILEERRKNKNIWESKIIAYLQCNKEMRFHQAKELTGLSKDRTRLVIKDLIKQNKIFLANGGNKAQYTLEPSDISFDSRCKLVKTFLLTNKTISNKQAQNLFSLKGAWAYTTLKKMVDSGLLEQHKPSLQKTYYTLKDH